MAAPRDPLNFIPADVFFASVPEFQQPNHVLSVTSSDSVTDDPLRYAAHVRLQGIGDGPETHCLVQFVTPQVWRIRYNPKFTSVDDYPDANSRTIVRDSFRILVDDLQQEFRDSEAWNSPDTSSDWFWKTTFELKAPGHWILSSVDFKNSNDKVGTVNTRLHFLDGPFRIVATRLLHPTPTGSDAAKDLGISDSNAREHVVWQTSPQTFSYQQDPKIGVINNVVMNVHKPGLAGYVGFGEQGGRTVLKKPTFMNYFCYDNYNYTKVYGKGALDPKEPLYHSSPFFLEVDGIPKFANVTGLMVDNYSQVAVDLGRTKSSSIGVATRFGTFDAYIMTADDVPRMIWQYSSIIGRAKLKPRFILGHHQGCYGYDSSATVNGIVDGYRRSQIPLDGMHLDVDFQDRYRTFTVNGINFPQVADFLKNLKIRGVKCCTNITPILTIRESDQDKYEALRNFWDVNDKLNPETNLLVADRRYLDGLPLQTPEATRYDGATYTQPKYTNPDNLNERLQYKDYLNGPVYRDNYVFIENDPSKQQGNYNSGFPYHGGVSYGTDLGTPGFYPDLNRRAARDRWGEQYQYLFDNGLEFVWQDMTTPAAGYCYGDMLGFPSRLLMSDDDTDPTKAQQTKTAMELWSLYSYNLHKATYHGLNRLKGRENKRNFIIGRGSQTGMHRFAGLWTGDNGSSWDFWRISVAQVLALGYSGLSIAGVDMGGFTIDPAQAQAAPPHWCDPELLIRWYSGSFLLPWYRNHYNQHFNMKVFQEPWQYSYVLEKYGNLVNPYNDPKIEALYNSVEPICRYYTQLRYSLIQVLYDTMFTNLINGLPIARAMLITDPHDTSLFRANDEYIDNQYLLGYNILVCPILNPGIVDRDVYLPGSDLWFPSNLRVNAAGFGTDPLGIMHAAHLENPVSGGATVSYGCPIPDAIHDPAQIPYVTPVYIRGGAIVPQLEVRQCINENDLNPPCIHVYPGNKDTSYSMYLDDGVSRDSAPAYLPQYKYREEPDGLTTDTGDKASEAQSKYREVKIQQVYQTKDRLVTLCHPWDGYDATPNIGTVYHLAIWTPKSSAPKDTNKVVVSFEDQNGKPVAGSGLSGYYDVTRSVVIVDVPVILVPSLGGPKMQVADGSSEGFLGVRVSGLN